MSNLLLNICLLMISIIAWFTKNFIIKLTLGLFLRYSYILGNFHPDILIEDILIKKRVLDNLFSSNENFLSKLKRCTKANISKAIKMELMITRRSPSLVRLWPLYLMRAINFVPHILDYSYLKLT